MYPKPNAVFSSVIGNQCAPSCDDLIDASVYNNTSSIVWNWTITEDNSLYPSNPTTSNVQNPNICFPDNQSGTDVEYTVELIIEDTYGCKDTTTENIIIYTRPVANFSIVDTGCGEVTYTPTNNSQNAVAWQWTVTPNTNVSIINPNDQQPNITFPENTSQGDSIVYTVELIVTSADSCTDTITEIVTIYPTPEVIFSVSDSVGCDSLEVIFTNNSDPFNGEDTTSMTFEWLVDGNPISTNTNTSYIFTNNTVNPITYEVILNGLTSHGCESSDTTYITIHPDPVSEINISANYDTTNCAPFVIDSNVISAGLYNNANDSYYWYIDSAGTVLNSYNTTGTIPPTYIMQQDGYSVTIYLITNNNDSCTSDTTSVIFTTVLDPVSFIRH